MYLLSALKFEGLTLRNNNLFDVCIMSGNRLFLLKLLIRQSFFGLEVQVVDVLRNTQFARDYY